MSQASGTPAFSLLPEERVSVSLNGCTFVSGGGTPEDASKAELMALLFVTGRDGIYASLSKPFAGWGGVGVVGSQAGGTRCLVSPSTKKKKKPAKQSFLLTASVSQLGAISPGVFRKHDATLGITAEGEQWGSLYQDGERNPLPPPAVTSYVQGSHRFICSASVG